MRSLGFYMVLVESKPSEIYSLRSFGPVAVGGLVEFLILEVLGDPLFFSATATEEFDLQRPLQFGTQSRMLNKARWREKNLKKKTPCLTWVTPKRRFLLGVTRWTLSQTRHCRMGHEQKRGLASFSTKRQGNMKDTRILMESSLSLSLKKPFEKKKATLQKTTHSEPHSLRSVRTEKCHIPLTFDKLPESHLR